MCTCARALSPLLFTTRTQTAPRRSGPSQVAPARRWPAARRKAARKRTADGGPAHGIAGALAAAAEAGATARRVECSVAFADRSGDRATTRLRIALDGPMTDNRLTVCAGTPESFKLHGDD